MKVVTILGARPQFVKAAPVREALRAAGHVEFLVHTGQHYDAAMSQIFFDEMGIAPPDVNLGVGSGSHGQQTGRMLMQIEDVLAEQKPDVVLVYGDTNSTLAGALAACKLGVPIAHVEAGLRSFNRSMPEEHNRVLTDHCAEWLFCPTQIAVENLAREGVTRGVHLVGDTMYDAVLRHSARARATSRILETLRLEHGRFLLATVHRPYNTDDDRALTEIVSALRAADDAVVFPVHPRTRQRLIVLGLLDGAAAHDKIRWIEPIGYYDMLTLEQNARMIVTDSGGVQKEAYFFAVPCVTLRPETEWIETVQAGWNRLVGADAAAILTALRAEYPVVLPPPAYGDGHAAEAIVRLLAQPSWTTPASPH